MQINIYVSDSSSCKRTKRVLNYIDGELPRLVRQNGMRFKFCVVDSKNKKELEGRGITKLPLMTGKAGKVIGVKNIIRFLQKPPASARRPAADDDYSLDKYQMEMMQPGGDDESYGEANINDSRIMSELSNMQKDRKLGGDRDKGARQKISSPYDSIIGSLSQGKKSGGGAPQRQPARAPTQFVSDDEFDEFDDYREPAPAVMIAPPPRNAQKRQPMGAGGFDDDEILASYISSQQDSTPGFEC